MAAHSTAPTVGREVARRFAVFCGHLEVSTYPIVWQTFYPASYMQKRNSGVTLLFSEKVPRIAGLFWARFWYTWFETFLAYGSTRSPRPTSKFGNRLLLSVSVLAPVVWVLLQPAPRTLCCRRHRPEPELG